MVAAVADKAVAEKLLAAGIEPETSTSEELRGFVKTEIAKWAEIVKEAGIEPQ
jgi:tripartite-type tricarboxylate transporter receptor subunit TctC